MTKRLVIGGPMHGQTMTDRPTDGALYFPDVVAFDAIKVYVWRHIGIIRCADKVRRLLGL